MNSKNILHQNNRWFLYWVFPMVLVLVVFYLFPLLDSLRLSMTDARIGASSDNLNYTANSYKEVLGDSDLPRVLGNTAIFVLITVVLQLGLGLFVGLLLQLELPGAALLKLAMICAWVVPGVITGIIWEILYSSAAWGVINNTIVLLGGEKIPFMSNANWAMFAAIVTNVWRGTGFSGIMQYGALKAINPQLYEAASIDGASWWKSFTKVTLPMLKPMLLINLVLITIYTMNTYDAIWSLTRGGPGIATSVLSLQTYKTTFVKLNLGQGAVYAVIMIAAATILASIYLKFLGEKEK